MFSRISAFLLVIAVAVNARIERHSHTRYNSTQSITNQCNTGNVRCCNTVTKAKNVASVLDFLSYSYDPADSVGLDCIPINIYGAGEGASCQAQPVCCSNNTYSGTVNVGCSPVDLN